MTYLLDRLFNFPSPPNWSLALSFGFAALMVDIVVLQLAWNQGVVPVAEHFDATLAAMPFGVAARVLVIATLAWRFAKRGHLLLAVRSAPAYEPAPHGSESPGPSGAIPLPREHRVSS